ncbi:hypothetical protein [Caminibacter pacificus]
MRYFVLVLFLFFSACSLKINPAEYHKINAPKAKYLPSQNEINAQTKVLILNISTNDPKTYFLLGSFKNLLENAISKTSAVLIQRNKKTTLKEEIIYAQEAELSNSNINSADYVINAKILSSSYSHYYHKGYYWKDKKGRTHYEPPYYSYRGCVSAQIEIIKIPQNYIAKTFYINDCAYDSSRYYQNKKRALLYEALKGAISNIQTELKNFFAKKGYIIEIRKKDDVYIIKTTLGAIDGIKEGDEVDVYTIKESINPLTNKPFKEIVKIASGEVSNVIHQNTSWIIVKDPKTQIKIGDFVKPKFDEGFFKRLFE